MVQAPRTLEARCRLKAPTKDPSAPAARMQAKKLMNGARPYGVGNQGRHDPPAPTHNLSGRRDGVQCLSCLVREQHLVQRARSGCNIGCTAALSAACTKTKTQQPCPTSRRCRHSLPVPAVSPSRLQLQLAPVWRPGRGCRWEAGELEDSGFVLR